MQNGWLWTLTDFCSYSLAFSLLTDISGVISFSELCLCHIYSVKCFWCKTSHLFIYYIHFMSLTFPSSDSPKQKKLLNRMLILWNVDWADTFYLNFCCFHNNTLSLFVSSEKSRVFIRREIKPCIGVGRQRQTAHFPLCHFYSENLTALIFFPISLELWNRPESELYR